MAKKAKSKAAKKGLAAGPRDVVSRQSKQPERRTIEIEKLGRSIKWRVPDAPYQDKAEQRSAFVGGFETRVQQVNSNLAPEEYSIPERFDAKLQQCFADGYNEAARQDGEHLKPKGLTGSKPK